MESWEVVDITEEMNVFDFNWVFKLKQFPGVFIKRFKGYFYSCVYQHLKGTDILETFTSVVQLTIVSMFLMLELLLDLISNLFCVIDSFIHADLEEGDNFLIKILMVFIKKENVMNLKKISYVFHQSPQ